MHIQKRDRLNVFILEDLGLFLMSGNGAAGFFGASAESIFQAPIKMSDQPRLPLPVFHMLLPVLM